MFGAILVLLAFTFVLTKSQSISILKIGSANMAFTSRDYDRAERHLLGFIKNGPCATALHRAVGVFYEYRGKDLELDFSMEAGQLERF